MKRRFSSVIFVICYLISLSFILYTDSYASSDKKKVSSWTVSNTVQAAFDYNPIVKQEQESRNVAKENLKQAESGNLPQINVYSGTGARTVLVPK